MTSRAQEIHNACCTIFGCGGHGTNVNVSGVQAAGDMLTLQINAVQAAAKLRIYHDQNIKATSVSSHMYEENRERVQIVRRWNRKIWLQQLR